MRVKDSFCEKNMVGVSITQCRANQSEGSRKRLSLSLKGDTYFSVDSFLKALQWRRCELCPLAIGGSSDLLIFFRVLVVMDGWAWLRVFARNTKGLVCFCPSRKAFREWQSRSPHPLIRFKKKTQTDDNTFSFIHLAGLLFRPGSLFERE